MELDPRRLRILRAVALRGGVVDAAALLHLTPSAVSQQLAQLELEVGMALLDRSRRRVGLTAAGKVLAARAERIENELAEARTELAGLSGRISGTVVVAAFPTVIQHVLAAAFAVLVHSQPEIRPSALDLQGQEALRELRTGGVDLVISESDDGRVEPELSGLTAHVLADDAYRIVVPRAWVPRPASIRDLAARPWVAAPPASACGRALDRISARHRFTPDRAHTCLDFPAALALVAAGLGVAILPELALATAPADAVVVDSIPHIGSRRLTVLHRASPGGTEPLVTTVIAALDSVVRGQKLTVPTV